MTAWNGAGLLTRTRARASPHRPSSAHQVDKATLVNRLERALVSVVSEVGVDINAAGRLEHMAAVLAYVPGLGIRKAEGIRKQLRAKVSARRDSAALPWSTPR